MRPALALALAALAALVIGFLVRGTPAPQEASLEGEPVGTPEPTSRSEGPEERDATARAPADGAGATPHTSDPVPRIRSVEIVLDDLRDAWALPSDQRASALAEAVGEVAAFVQSSDASLLRMERSVVNVRDARIRACALLALARRGDLLAERALARLGKTLWGRSEVERLATVVASTYKQGGRVITLAALGDLEVSIGDLRETPELRDALTSSIQTAPSLGVDAGVRADAERWRASTPAATQRFFEGLRLD